MNRDSMIFYASFHDAAKELESDAQRGELYHAIFEYSLYGIEPDLKGIVKGYWKLIKPQLDANIRKYENGIKGGKHGSKGGRPPKGNNPKETPKKPLKNPNETPNVNVNGNENVNDNGNEKKENTANAKFNFLSSLIALGVTEQVAKDWMQVRKKKRAADTLTAFESIEREIKKSGQHPNICIKKAAESSWAGFRANWMDEKSQQINPDTGQLDPSKMTPQQKAGKTINGVKYNSMGDPIVGVQMKWPQ